MDVPVFSTSPDPTCMYMTSGLEEAVAKIRRAIHRKLGLSCIFGDNGFGKSSLLRKIASGYDADDSFVVALVANKTADITPYTFLREISREFDIPLQRSRLAQMYAIEEFLDAQHHAAKTVLLLVDEAQKLRIDSMECIRSLLNYETNTAKLCQIVLTGELTFRDRLMTPKYKAFKSRIVAPVVLELFTAEEVEAMIAYRLRYWKARNPFTHEACLRMYEVTRGVPRECVVLAGYAYDMHEQLKLDKIDPDLIDTARQQLDTKRKRESVEAEAESAVA